MTPQQKKKYADYEQHALQVLDDFSINTSEDVFAKKDRIAELKKDYTKCCEYYFPHYCTSPMASFHIKFANKIRKNKRYFGIVEWPRGHAKSVHCNLMLPFWLWINKDIRYFILVGETIIKAKDLIGDLQTEFEKNPRIANDYGEQKATVGDWTEGDFTINNGFRAKAMSIGQSVRGVREKASRPDYITVDDVETLEISNNPKRIRSSAKWIEGDLIGTMDIGTKRFIKANTDNFPESIQRTLKKSHPKWHINRVLAYDPATYQTLGWTEKYPNSYWKEVEEDMGILAAQAEFNHNPHTEGLLFKDEMIHWGAIPELDEMDSIIGYWDVAFSGNNDYNAIKIWGRKGQMRYLIDCHVRKCKIADAIEFMFDWQIYYNFQINWYVESQFWNTPIDEAYLDIRNDRNCEISLIRDDRPKGKKYDRIIGLLPLYQQNRIIYNEKMKGHPDMIMGLAQLKGIEPGYKGHDDSPDADAGALNILNRGMSGRQVGQGNFGGKRRPVKY